MTRLLICLSIVAMLSLGISADSNRQLGAQTSFEISGQNDTCTKDSCGEYGTQITFAESPAEAARRALKEEKLVFVLHVSGNFETPEYT